MTSPHGSDPATPLAGRTVVVTGASDGIGAAAVPGLQTLGARVVIVGRSPQKTAAVAASTGAEFLVADFAELAQVAELAAKLRELCPQIDVLANNAGLAAHKRVVTVDGHESTFQINHLAPFLLTRLLQDRLVASTAVVIQTASLGNMLGRVKLEDLEMEKRFSPFIAYATSKLENILFTQELQKRWGDLGVTAASFHPGVVRSSFGKASSPLFRLTYNSLASRLMTSPEGGADTLVWLASSQPGVDWVPGGHYEKRHKSMVNRAARDPKLAEGLWEKSEELLAGFLP